MKHKFSISLFILLSICLLSACTNNKQQANTNRADTNQANINQTNVNQVKSANLDDFAKCLKEKGATFYGASWCGHCQKQKTMFGEAQKYLPYVECSAPDGKSQTDVCKDKQISGYPTWVFADGSRQAGEISLQKLADKTGCQLPE